MYNEQIENLIKMALTDSELSEKEKQILFRKAEAAGIDLDEFEMVLEARLFDKQNSSSQEAPAAATPPPAPAPVQHTEAPKSNKMGDIKKCPSCGGIVETFSTSCGDCGHSFNNITAVSSAQRLHDQLQEIEKEERNRERTTISSFTSRLTGGAAEQMQADSQMEERIKKRKASVISSFPIPNSKEDILEFLSMAIPEVGNKPNFLMRMTATGTLYKAWVSKAEQIVMKARFSMKEDKKTLEEINHYAKELGIK
jgi:hypothetical protein